MFREQRRQFLSANNMTTKHSLVKVDLFQTKNSIQVTAYCVELKTIVKESEYKISGILVLFFLHKFLIFVAGRFCYRSRHERYAVPQKVAAPYT